MNSKNKLVVTEKMMKQDDPSTLACEVYGFAGKLGSGKNYLAEQIFLPLLNEVLPKRTMVVAFADLLKINTCLKWHLPFRTVFGQKTFALRSLLQRTGTEDRQKYGANIYVRSLELWCRLLADRGIQRLIVTDVRMPNEVMWIKKFQLHKLFRIVAPHRTERRIRQEASARFRDQNDEENESCWQRIFRKVKEKLSIRHDLSYEEICASIRNHATETSLDFVPAGTFDYTLHNDFDDGENVNHEISHIVASLLNESRERSAP